MNHEPVESPSSLEVLVCLLRFFAASPELHVLAEGLCRYSFSDTFSISNGLVALVGHEPAELIDDTACILWLMLADVNKHFSENRVENAREWKLVRRFSNEALSQLNSASIREISLYDLLCEVAD